MRDVAERCACTVGLLNVECTENGGHDRPQRVDARDDALSGLDASGVRRDREV